MLTDTFDATAIILIVAILLLLGVFTTKFSTRFGLPALVLFIGIGMVMGSDIAGIIYFDNPKVAQLIGIFALIMILFEGGLQTEWKNVKRVATPSITLATIGVLLTALVVGVGAKYIIGLAWWEALLFGAIVGSTDAAAVFSVLRGQNVKGRLEGTLEAESGTNDPMAIFLTVSLISLITVSSINFAFVFISFLWQMGIGLLLGFAFGKLALFSINNIKLDSSGLYPVLASAFAILTYSFTSIVHASGFLAVYIAALVIGNHDLTYRHSILRFHEGFAWMMQITMFVLLGLFMFPSQLLDWTIIWQGLLLSIILMFVARPISVYVSLHFFPFDWKEKAFLSWAGLRGAVPIILATFPMIAGIENSQIIFNLVFFIVLTSTLLQGASIPYVAKKLQLTKPPKKAPTHILELTSLQQTNAEIVEFFIDSNNQNIGRKITDLPLPNDVLVNAIIREDELIPPHGQTIIYEDDILFVLVKSKDLNIAKQVLLTKEEKI
ncbi:potassium/proton antiporter [Evansella cellulosilytica]|uniref:Sodium/hydrogen exchanger n=1 Tax=Evansella cellulosilytica (strain ATCC 21833 / DSM 2522 / FERM P-1141 / JCM 9156 / N-4) TaxID=649639 RepID=E6TUB5_EVAC2|nr:potassium/proton antiporter [Evansella cellulosilytica]ADU29671.1 sodium/hydrogen exchanger [Evansella cellulosilytica DSM 2522]